MSLYILQNYFQIQRQERVAVGRRRRSAPPLPAATRQHLFYITCSICIPKTQKMLFKQSSFDHYKFTLKSNVHCASPLSIARVHMCYTFCAQCALEESTINTKIFETGQRSLKKIKEVCRTLNKDSAEM